MLTHRESLETILIKMIFDLISLLCFKLHQVFHIMLPVLDEHLSLQTFA